MAKGKVAAQKQDKKLVRLVLDVRLQSRVTIELPEADAEMLLDNLPCDDGDCGVELDPMTITDGIQSVEIEDAYYAEKQP